MNLCVSDTAIRCKPLHHCFRLRPMKPRMLGRLSACRSFMSYSHFASMLPNLTFLSFYISILKEDSGTCRYSTLFVLRLLMYGMLFSFQPGIAASKQTQLKTTLPLCGNPLDVSSPVSYLFHCLHWQTLITTQWRILDASSMGIR